MVKIPASCKGLLGFGFGMALSLGSLTAPSFAEETCKRKTAGFFLQYLNVPAGEQLKQNLQSSPVSLTGTPGDPERGKQVLLNQQKGDCLSCHQLRALTSINEQGTIGPSLDGLATKYNDGQLRQIVVNPKTYFTNTIMPSYYKTGKDAAASILTAVEVEDLVAYLRTLK